jgi:LytS/YehU family sensor histidine kinase
VEYLIEEGTILKSMIPSMMIQIPVENAIKHGLMPIEGEKILIIRVTNDNEYQHITIKDNGIGLNASKGLSTGTGTGLKVLLQTILLLNAKNSQKIKFSINDNASDSSFTSGTAVEIEIPLSFNYALDKK